MHSTMVDVLIIGAGAAGMAAASRIKRLKPDYNVTVVEKTKYASFALCGIPYLAGCTVKTIDELLYYKPEYFAKKRGINMLLEHEVVGIDKNTQTATVKNLKTGDTIDLHWDKLVLATGARSRAPEFWPEIETYENVFYIKHLDTGDQVRNYALHLPHGSTAVVVGAGYVGLEMAENLANLGLKVVLVEALGQVAPRALDPDLAEIVRERLESKGVKVVLNAPVKEFRGRDGRATSIATEEGEIEGDMFVVGVGIRPNTELAEMIGARIGETRAVWTNEKLETSVNNVYAIGDVAEHTDIVSGRRVWRPFAPVANKMGYTVGNIIAGRDAYFPGSVGTAVFKVFGLTGARTGLSKKEAEKAGFTPVEASLEGSTKAHYMPGAVKIKLKVIADQDTGRLLGAQAVGDSETVMWRINVIAGLLTARATVWDLFYSDLGYAPPLAPVWDPLIIAARLLMRKIGPRPVKQ